MTHSEAAPGRPAGVVFSLGPLQLPVTRWDPAAADREREGSFASWLIWKLP